MFSILLNIAVDTNGQDVNRIILLPFLAVVVLVIGILGIYLYDPSWFSRRITIIKAIRSRLFVRKAMGSKELQKAVKDAGFIYDWKQDIFYSSMDPWQREYGYCRSYDELCPLFGMIVDSEPIYFYYGGKNWLIEFWKGQYDLTTGCEVGIYTKEGMKLDNPRTAFYNSAGNGDRIFISYVVKKKLRTLFTRADKHWWLTGFIVGEFTEPSDLLMEIDITLKNRQMRNSFVNGLSKAGYMDNEFYVTGNSVKIIFDKPHSQQPVTRTPITDKITQERNYILCRNFVDMTASENSMGAKLESIEKKSPELLAQIMNIGRTRKLLKNNEKNITGTNAKDRISQVYRSAKQLDFNDSSKIVLISDCHRGNGSLSDDFLKNQNLYYYALTHYYYQNYTYIELGDGDELWENKHFSDIKKTYTNIFWLLSKFYKEGRLHVLYGNHDIVKKSNKFVINNLYEFYDEHKNRYVPLFENINIPEGLVLNYTETGNKILLLHGHQGDFLNDTMWRLARFLVRYVWKPLEMIGINDPTSPAINYNKKEKVTGKMIEWAKKENIMLIAGHTHKPAFPDVGETLYFNDGSCVHPRCITAIEIADGNIQLIKWNLQTKNDAALFIGKEILAGPVKLSNFFTKKRMD